MDAALRRICVLAVWFSDTVSILVLVDAALRLHEGQRKVLDSEFQSLF